MPRTATLFEDSGGSAVRAYLLLKASGSANVPPNWIERSRKARKNREANIANIMKKGRVQDFPSLEEWEIAYRKECFYRGIRVLLELERNGSSKI
jgi:hypothetical protein